MHLPLRYHHGGLQTGTQAAVDFSDKLQDAAHAHRLTGCCPTVAVHVMWDFPDPKNRSDLARAGKLAEEVGTKIGSINPSLFVDQCYKFGSFGNVDGEIRKRALEHCLDSIEIGKIVDSQYMSMWFADGTNYPAQANIRSRKRNNAHRVQTIRARFLPH